ncbi:hypothetical protein Tco_1241293 [Tanacetum coccineum]
MYNLGVIKESNEEDLDHSKKLKGIETLSVAAQFMIDMKKIRKASRNEIIIQRRSKGPSEGSSVIPEVPDGPSDSSSISLSRFDDEIEDISSDNERTEVDDSKKVDEEKASIEQVMDEQAKIEQPRKVQSDVLEPQVEKLPVQLISSSLTLSSAKYGNQFINDNLDVSLTDVLKELVEAEV